MTKLHSPAVVGSLLAVLVLLALPLFGQGDSCAACHAELDGALKSPVDAFARDIHQKYGLGCKDCHGGNPGEDDIEKAKDRTFKGKPARKLIPELCGSCHSNAAFMRRYNPNIRVDQLALYRTSQHGLLLARGDAKAAVCTDCHDVHGILPANMPKSSVFPWNVPATCGRCHSDTALMQGYGLRTDQVEDYKASVHARALLEKKDLTAPVCNDCHGNHGALPPEVASIAFVCRQCHASTAELFGLSAHKKAFDAMGAGECEACHGHHRILPPTDEMLGTGEASVCLSCHEPSTKPYETASRMRSVLDRFNQRMDQAADRLDRAERQGVHVSKPRVDLQEARTALILMRNLTHGLSLEEIDKQNLEGDKVLEAVLEAGAAALREARSRRLGLVVATAFLALLAVALFFKVRQISRNKSA